MTKRIKILISLLLISLIFRLFLVFQVYSGDLNNHMTWAAQILDTTPKNAYNEEYPGVMQPTYPPVSLLNFISSEFIYRQVMSAADFLNQNVSLFPSKLIWLFEDSDFRPAFYKILNIITDLGIGILIFRFTRSNFLSALFLLNPAVWYLSSLWGQIDYVPIFFILLSYFYISPFYLGLALLTKQTTIVFIPIYLIYSYFKKGLSKTFFDFLSVFLLFAICYLLFAANPITTYLDRLNTGSGSVWINDNAFNPWVFISQMRKIPDTQYRTWSVVAYTLFSITILIKLINIKKINLKNIFWQSFLISAGAFFILTRMHERYFAPALPFLILLSQNSKKLSAICILASIIHLLNMYHWWWYPSVSSIVNLLSSISTLYILSSIFTIIFIYLVYEYFKQPTE